MQVNSNEQEYAMIRKIWALVALFSFACAVLAPSLAFAGGRRDTVCVQEDACVRLVCQMNEEARRNGEPYFYEITQGQALRVTGTQNSGFLVTRGECRFPVRRMPKVEESQQEFGPEHVQEDAQRVSLQAVSDAYIEALKAEGRRADAEAARADAQAVLVDAQAAYIRVLTQQRAREQAAAPAAPVEATAPPVPSAADLALARDVYNKECLDDNSSDRCQKLKIVLDRGAK